MLGNLVVALNMSIFSADMLFAEMEMALGVNNLSQLAKCLNRLSQKKVIDMGLLEVRNAAKNIANEIGALIATVRK